MRNHLIAFTIALLATLAVPGVAASVEHILAYATNPACHAYLAHDLPAGFSRLENGGIRG